LLLHFKIKNNGRSQTECKCYSQVMEANYKYKDYSPHRKPKN